MCMFRTPYSKAVRAPSHGITFTEESKTLQSEYESTTIDWYLRRYSATGVDPFADRALNARFGDFSNYQSFLDAQNKLAGIRQGFEQLPSEIRARFNNNINAFMEFVTDPQNADECVSMGLIQTPEQTPVEVPAEAPAEAPVIESPEVKAE